MAGEYRANLRKRTIRNTSRTRRSPGKTNANQNGRTARRSITPSGLETNSQRALRSLECRSGPCSARHPNPQSVLDGENDERQQLDRDEQRPILRLQHRHRLERHRDEIRDDQNDDEPADDQTGAVSDRAVLQNLIQAAPEISATAPDTSRHS